MKKIFHILFFSFVIHFSALSQGKIVLEGSYKGQNFFIRNPECDIEPTTFCVQKVEVNGTEIHHDQASAFEIRLDSLGLMIGDSLHIVITHDNECKPRVIFPQNHSRVSTFKIVSIEINNDGMLNWVTSNEKSKLPYIIEQYRWNKWVKIGEVDGQGSFTENNYSFKVIPHSGKNEIRVCQIDPSGMKRPSSEVIFVSNEPIVEHTVNNNDKKIIFSAETLFELYDDRGNMLHRGYSNQVDCSVVKNGIYYLNYDNKNVKIVFKKTKDKTKS